VLRRSTHVSLFLFLCAASVPIAVASEPGTGSAAPMPLVFRGEAVSGVASGEAVAGLAVPVLRGSGVVANARRTAMDRVASGDGSAMPWRLVGGEKLWFVDSESGRVIACRERNTATVGRRAIDCTGRTLRALVR
jgi:hypothetical protein